MKRLIAFILSLAALSTGAGAQILSSAHPEEDAAAFARVRARMDSIRRYRPTTLPTCSTSPITGVTAYASIGFNF